MIRELLLTSGLLSLVYLADASSFMCDRYVHGEPTGLSVKVQATSKEEAEPIAYRRMLYLYTGDNHNEDQYRYYDAKCYGIAP